MSGADTLNLIGRTSVRVPALGFGAAAIGNLYRPLGDEAASACVTKALEAGIRYFDTAPRYGHGLSERRLGAVLPHDVIVSTKVGRVLTPIAPPPSGTQRHGFVDGDPFEEHFDYSYDGVMRSFESSLTRLKRDHIDILLAHDLGQLTHGDDHDYHLKAFLSGGLKAMQTLKSEGRIGAIGLGVNETEICDNVLDHADLDAILLAGRYTLLEQAPLEAFLPRCVARNVSIILGGPFNSGILITGVGNGHTPFYDYAPAPPEIIARVHRIEAICADHHVPLAAAALQFPLAHPAVASVIPGMATPDEVRSNAALFHHPIPPALWDDLKTGGLIPSAAPTPAPTPETPVSA
ncbi:aldo/keto reductase [Asticcacaulis endophyticus]|uniref:Oxidoreductase n=1 Tax=Asticcacaulis endophyticus TaxID=1395890 RepID=A0A918Q0K2_9CAUL|nr:aldo/keto reductase [Asticcacaulis endophyticus]GGZ28161.1 oxidoreductase [Asticcacaulis endophyticus]